MSVIVIGAAWCSGCGALKKSLVDREVEFEYVDADTEQGADMLATHRVRSLPTTLITKVDGEVEVVVGNKLQEILDLI